MPIHTVDAHAVCVAAKVPPGDLALVAFCVHSSSVDQVLIRKEWYDAVFATEPSKLLSYVPPPAPLPGQKRQQQFNALLINPPMNDAPLPIHNKAPSPEDIEGPDSHICLVASPNRNRAPQVRPQTRARHIRIRTKCWAVTFGVSERESRKHNPVSNEPFLQYRVNCLPFGGYRTSV